MTGKEQNTHQILPKASSNALQTVQSEQYDYLEDQNVDELICSICLFPFVDPISHSTCGNTFCSTCVEKVVNCPMCGEDEFKKNCSPSAKVVINMLDKLKVRCGMCKTIVPRGELKDHQDKYCPLHGAYQQVEELKKKLEAEHLEKLEIAQKELEEKMKSLQVDHEQYLQKAQENLTRREEELLQQAKKKEELLENQMKELKNQVVAREKFESTNKPIHLNVGGTILTVSLGAFIHNEREPDNLFKKMFTGEYPLYQTPSKKFNDPIYFIDCDPVIFKLILDWLKFGIIGNELSDDMKQSLLCSCNSFGIENITKHLKEKHKQVAKMSQFDFMNVVNLARSQKSKLNLSGLDLRKLVLNSTDLKNAEILGSDFSGMNLKNTDFKGGILIGCNFSNCTLTSVRIQDCNLEGCDFSNTIFKNTDILKNNLSGANFENAQFEKCKIQWHFKKGRDNNLKYCKFVDCNFDGSIFEEIDFFESILSSSNIFNTGTIKNADLRQWKDLSKFKEMKFDSCVFNFTEETTKDIIVPFECDIIDFETSLALYSHTESKAIPQLLYKGTRDGFNGYSFHPKCDNRGPTLTIIKSEHDQIFGGFTSKPWTSNRSPQTYVSDESAFIFKIEKDSTNQNYQFRKFNIKQDKKQYAINVFEGFLPKFGEDIYICNDCDSQNQSYSGLGYAYESPNNFSSNETQSYLAGSSPFKVKEIEVFLIKNY
ncbi:predicted protein [Naegleria gruberi]|uniref:Predicted protein n=1 Tax=Naegleria gruberi TaxID=5762 RepID=D2VDD4_NAEGR|nr:uncharacterized protein NAEGRDRAFT_48585 [Naegleria gruberi]EFC45125.1 predicted protein [Naegleria gruberi]|eukprot:XP_002677869.1 predicted protein [Naegleria gruberi strain NEG-M]